MSYRFKLRPPHNIGGGTHFSGGTNPDSGGTFVPPFKLLKYALETSPSLVYDRIMIADAKRDKAPIRFKRCSEIGKRLNRYLQGRIDGHDFLQRPTRLDEYRIRATVIISETRGGIFDKLNF